MTSSQTLLHSAMALMQLKHSLGDKDLQKELASHKIRFEHCIFILSYSQQKPFNTMTPQNVLDKLEFVF